MAIIFGDSSVLLRYLFGACSVLLRLEAKKQRASSEEKAIK
ncbi:hypothetical protein [Sphingobacterium siyangense]